MNMFQIPCTESCSFNIKQKISMSLCQTFQVLLWNGTSALSY